MNQNPVVKITIVVIIIKFGNDSITPIVISKDEISPKHWKIIHHQTHAIREPAKRIGFLFPLF